MPSHLVFKPVKQLIQFPNFKWQKLETWQMRTDKKPKTNTTKKQFRPKTRAETHTDNQQTYKDACTHPKQPKKNTYKNILWPHGDRRSLRQNLKSHVLELFFLQGVGGGKDRQTCARSSTRQTRVCAMITCLRKDDQDNECVMCAMLSWR